MKKKLIPKLGNIPFSGILIFRQFSKKIKEIADQMEKISKKEKKLEIVKIFFKNSNYGNR